MRVCLTIIGLVTGLVAIPNISAAQGASIRWTRQFGTTGGSNDVAFAVAVDAGGNAYVAGQVFGALAGQTSAGSGDVFLRKYHPDGSLMWTRQFGTTGNDIAFAVAALGDAVYVAGSVRGALPGQTVAGGEDAFVRKYDIDGNEVWTDQFGSVSVDQIRGIAVDSSPFALPGRIYAVGQTFASLPGQTNFGSADAFIRSYDDLGGTTSVAWTQQFGTTAIDIAFAVTARSGGIFVAGRTDGDLDGPSGPETYKGMTDVFVRRLDASGSVDWTRQLGTSLSDVGQGIAVHSSGMYLVGSTSGDIDGGGPGIASGGQDAFVVRLDLSGATQWTRQVGTSGTDIAFGVSVDSEGVHVTGRSGGELAGSGNFVGVSDVYVQTWDELGGLVRTRQFGSLGFDLGNAIAADGTSIYIAGQADGALPEELQAENGGNTDAFLTRYDGSGNALWIRRFGTLGPVADTARAVGRAVDNGQVYVVGDTRGALPGQPNVGLNDAFVRKYDRDGNVIWTRQYGSGLNDFALSVAAGPRGLVCTAGRSDAAQPGQTFAGGLSDAYVKCFDTDGKIRWTEQFGTSEFDSAGAIALDVDGSVYVAGRTDGAFDGQSQTGVFDAFVRKYDAFGGELWTRQFGSTATFATGVTADGLGNVYVIGQTFGTLPGQPSVLGPADAFIRKYDSDGNELWTRQFGSFSLDSANSVASSGDGFVYIGGDVGAALPGKTFLGGVEDGFVRKYDGDGNEIWTIEVGTSLADSVVTVAIGAAGDLYAGGHVGGALPGYVSAGIDDAFIGRFSGADGATVWTRQFGSNQRDSVSGLAVYSERRVEAVIGAGDTDGALPGQTSAGDVDAFVIKIVQSP